MTRKRCGWPQPGPYVPDKPLKSVEATAKDTPESNRRSGPEGDNQSMAREFPQSTAQPDHNLSLAGEEKKEHDEVDTRSSHLRLWVLGTFRQRISAYLLELGKDYILLDAGWLNSGYGLSALLPAGITAASLAAVVISHAHKDHMMGLLDLQKWGLRCKIFCSVPTNELLTISLVDAAKFWRSTEGADRLALDCLNRVVPLDYGIWFEIAAGIRIRLHHAGHLVGAAIIEVEFDTGSKKVRLCYTGDLGGRQDRCLRAPKILPANGSTDYLIIGAPKPDRPKRSPNVRQAFAQIITDGCLRARQSTSTGPGVILLTVSSLGQGPIILRELALLQNREQIPPEFPIFAFSTMLQASIQVHQACVRSTQSDMIFQAEVLRLAKNGVDPFRPPGYSNLPLSSEVYRRILRNQHSEPVIIICSSLSNVGGRLLAALQPQFQNTIVSSASNTEPTALSIRGQRVTRACHFEVMPSGLLEGHADEATVRWWLGKSFPSAPPKHTLIVHGNDQAKGQFAESLRNKGWSVDVPSFRQCLELKF